jgi:hypothetical protein
VVFALEDDRWFEPRDRMVALHRQLGEGGPAGVVSWLRRLGLRIRFAALLLRQQEPQAVGVAARGEEDGARGRAVCRAASEALRSYYRLCFARPQRHASRRLSPRPLPPAFVVRPPPRNRVPSPPPRRRTKPSPARRRTWASLSQPPCWRRACRAWQSTWRTRWASQTLPPSFSRAGCWRRPRAGRTAPTLELQLEGWVGLACYFCAVGLAGRRAISP